MPVQLENLNVESHEVLITPEQLKRRLPVPEKVREQVNQHRDSVREIVEKTDKRLLVVVGPCSIHDPSSALEYAKRLKLLAEQLNDRLLLVMRCYFEKPRSTVGWKGLINDPFLDDSFKVNEGLHIARELLLDISALGLPLATEALDPITPQYLQELFSWSAIGARTTESQTHREMASGLSCAVGFKNGTDGSLDVAINALQSVAQPHRFLGISTDGQVSVDMGEPVLDPPKVPCTFDATQDGAAVRAKMEVDGETWLVTAVSMGNPHCVTFGKEGQCDDGGIKLDDFALSHYGPMFEKHPTFPAKTNTEFTEVVNRNYVKMHVWERGAGATLACGTGACATLVAAVLEGRTERKCTVELPGGPLEIEWRESDNRVIMTGPAELVFDGTCTTA